MSSLSKVVIWIFAVLLAGAMGFLAYFESFEATIRHVKRGPAFRAKILESDLFFRELEKVLAQQGATYFVVGGKVFISRSTHTDLIQKYTAIAAFDSGQQEEWASLAGEEVPWSADPSPAD